MRGNHCILNNTIQTKRLHTSSMSSFSSKLDCIISKFEAKTKWSDFSFVKLFYIKHLYETNQKTGWIEGWINVNVIQIHSLPAGGAWTSIKHSFLGCRCKQNRAAVRNTTLICITRKMKRKYHFNFFKTASFPQRYIHINSYTKWLAFFSSLTSHESKSSLESAVHESKSSPKSLFMRLKCDSSPSRRLEFPSLHIGNLHSAFTHSIILVIYF